MDDHQVHVPRAALFGMAAMVVLTLGTATAARLGFLEGPMIEAPTGLDATALLRFADTGGGAIAVFASDAGTERAIDTLSPDTYGFVRGILRVVHRDRMLHEKPADAPFRITRWTDGRLTLEDPETGTAYDLNPFGPDNIHAFSRLVDLSARAS